ncbi:uncharacterized protein VTP21DRAFT_2845 [Calcarisporiella thermophila]|uniref:uncharacterized protein n=1 Tax=Calcarisporiella thermophila TaxID=911321 RepID=UPI0037431223
MRINRLFILPLLLSLSVVRAQDSELTTQQLLDQAHAHLAAGRPQDALQAYDQAILKDPQNYLSYFKRAATYLSLGKHRAALDDFSKILSLKPDFEQALLQRAKLLAQEGSFDEAERDLRKFLGMRAKDGEATQLLSNVQQAQTALKTASTHFAGGRHSECVKVLDPAINTAPNHPRMRLLRGRCRLMMGEEGAMGDLQRAASLDPSNADTLREITLLTFYTLNDRKQALTNVKSCLHYDPEHKVCKALYRQLKQLDRDIQQASQDLEAGRIIGATNKLVGSGQRTGAIRASEQAMEELAKEFKSMTKEKSKLLAELYGMACRASRERETDELRLCGEALRFDPDNVDALLGHANALMRNSQYDDALRDLNKAHTLTHGQDRRVLEAMSRCQRMLRQSKRRDYYKVLGVPRDAGAREIKKAYRKLAQEWHPDKYRGDLPKEEVAKKMSEINEAYEVLSNEELKARYDSGDDPNDPEGQHGFHYQHGGNPFGPFGGEGFPFFQAGGFPFQQGGDGQWTFKMHFG